MYKCTLLLSLLLVTECVMAQRSLPRKALVNKANIGKSELIRQSDGSLIYVTATGGNFFSGRILANSEVDDTYNGERSSNKLANLINCKTLAATIDKWGRLLIAGSSSSDAKSARMASMTRLTKNGDLDDNFTPGTVQVKVGDSSEFVGVYLQKDEKIVGLGSCFVDGAKHFFLSGFRYNGEPDSSYGTNGVVIDKSIPGSNKLVASVAQPDGKYIAVGNNITDGLPNIVVARYYATGQKDTAFGSKGVSLTAIEAHGYLAATKVLLQADDKIVVAGMCTGDSGRQDIFIVRYTSDGAIDPTFGQSGLVKLDITNDDRIDDLIALPGGRLLLSGAGTKAGERKYGRYIMIRLSADGIAEKNYGYGSVGGFAPNSVGKGFTALAHNIAVSPRDGKVYRLSELISDNETETILTFTTFLQDSALGIVDIPTGKLQNFVYPLPVAASAVFSFELIEDLNISIKLTDADGKEKAAIATNKAYKEGENSFAVNFPANCKPGKYLVVLSSTVGYKVTLEVNKT